MGSEPPILAFSIARRTVSRVSKLKIQTILDTRQASQPVGLVTSFDVVYG